MVNETGHPGINRFFCDRKGYWTLISGLGQEEGKEAHVSIFRLSQLKAFVPADYLPELGHVMLPGLREQVRVKSIRVGSSGFRGGRGRGGGGRGRGGNSRGFGGARSGRPATPQLGDWSNHVAGIQGGSGTSFTSPSNGARKRSRSRSGSGSPSSQSSSSDHPLSKQQCVQSQATKYQSEFTLHKDFTGTGSNKQPLGVRPVPGLGLDGFSRSPDRVKAMGKSAPPTVPLPKEPRTN